MWVNEGTLFGFVLFFFRFSIQFFFSLHIFPWFFSMLFFLFFLSVHFNLMYFSSIINEKVLYLQKVSLGLRHICTFAMENINWFNFTWYHSFDGKCCVDRYSQKIRSRLLVNDLRYHLQNRVLILFFHYRPQGINTFSFYVSNKS